jgi:hypothetical protein
MDVSLVDVVFCAGRGLCYGANTCPEYSCGQWCVIGCVQGSIYKRPRLIAAVEPREKIIIVIHFVFPI